MGIALRQAAIGGEVLERHAARRETLLEVLTDFSRDSCDSPTPVGASSGSRHPNRVTIHGTLATGALGSERLPAMSMIVTQTTLIVCRQA